MMDDCERDAGSGSGAGDAANPTDLGAGDLPPRAACLIRGDLRVSRSDDGQYLLLYARQTLLAICGAMGADPEVVEFADGSRYAVEELLDLAGSG